jgi:uroporphyrinogen decarboxylase
VEAKIMAKRTGTMTDRERIEALLRHEKPDRVPFFPFAAAGFAVVYSKASIADAYNKPEVSLAAQRKTCRDFGWIFLPMIGYAAFGGWEFGGEMKWPSGEFSQAPTVTRRAVETEEDVWKLKPPDVKNAGITPIAIDFFKLSSQERLDNEPWNVSSHVEGAFNVAANICGAQTLARWLIRKPEAAHRLLQMASDYLIERAQYLKDTFGVDGILPSGGEPSASNDVISPKHFEEFALPYLKKVYDKVLDMGYKHIFIHICGEQNLNLPYWSQISFGAPGLISIGHEIEFETAAKYFPNDIIVGNLEPAIIQTQKPDEVYEASRRVIEKGKKCPGGYIFSPGCELPPMAPVENVMAMTNAVNDFGWYD